MTWQSDVYNPLEFVTLLADGSNLRVNQCEDVAAGWIYASTLTLFWVASVLGATRLSIYRCRQPVCRRVCGRSSSAYYTPVYTALRDMRHFLEVVFQRSDDLDLWRFEVKIYTSCLSAGERSYQLWLFYAFFEFRVRTWQTDKRTDGRTGKTRNAAQLQNAVV